MKKVTIEYYALLREERGISRESIETAAATLRDLYEDLKKRYQFRLPVEQLRVAVNDEFVPWEKDVYAGDQIVFIPPVAGG